MRHAHFSLQTLFLQIPRFLYLLPLILISFAPTNQQVTLATKLLLLLLTMWAAIHPFPLKPSIVLVFLFPGWAYLSLLWSHSPATSLSGAIQVTYYASFYALLRTTRFKQTELVWGMRFLVLIAAILSLDGLRQLIYGYEEHVRYLQQQRDILLPSNQQLLQDWVNALSGRVFSRFLLPSQLAGYLLMIIPMNMLLVFRGSTLVTKIGWGGILALNSLVFLYTKSFGGWLSLLGMFVVGGYLLFTRTHPMTWKTLLKASVCCAIIGVGILYAIGFIRGQYLWQLDGNSPLWYRFLNWKIALDMFRDHPWLGTGFLTFGKMYPQYMLPGANESQYVHNTYLQFASELGLVGFLGILWGLGSWGVAALRELYTTTPYSIEEPSSSILQKRRFETTLVVCLGSGGFLLHNCVDFDFYVFPLGLLGMALLAVTLTPLTSERPEKPGTGLIQHPVRSWRWLLLACGLVLMYRMDWHAVQAQQEQAQAESLIRESRYQEAHAVIQNAYKAFPGNAEYSAAEGNLLLALQQPQVAILRLESAIRYEPETPWFHASLAQAYLAQANISMAYLESRRAAELFPLRPPYQEQVQLIETLYPKD